MERNRTTHGRTWGRWEGDALSQRSGETLTVMAALGPVATVASPGLGVQAAIKCE